MKTIDFLIGVKAEQTLRDAVRSTSEESPDHTNPLELCPVGNKDWQAGIRLSGPIRFGDLEGILDSVIKQLWRLGSLQRIRRESLRLHAVPKPVPVFKETEPKEPAQVPSETGDEITCAACGAKAHRYNIQYDPWGNMIGCFFCRPNGGG